MKDQKLLGEESELKLFDQVFGAGYYRYACKCTL